MITRIPLISDRCGVFAPQYFGSVGYYATMARYRRVVVDRDLRYDKRFKSVHRCEIADTRGRLMLTVPVSKSSPRRWADATVSDHGGWWDVHRVSLESAYGRTPFFEYYIDRFLPLVQDTSVSIVDLDCCIDAVVRRTLGLECEVEYAVGDMDAVDDYRRGMYPSVADVPYYQVRADRLGFLPGLSILDLIFNMGPEAPLMLERMYNAK